jgi:hypothetical protein
VAHACGTQSMANAAKRELVAAYDIITCNLKIPLKKIKVRPTLPLPHSPHQSARTRHTQTPTKFSHMSFCTLSLPPYSPMCCACASLPPPGKVPRESCAQLFHDTRIVVGTALPIASATCHDFHFQQTKARSDTKAREKKLPLARSDTLTGEGVCGWVG